MMTYTKQTFDLDVSLKVDDDNNTTFITKKKKKMV